MRPSGCLPLLGLACVVLHGCGDSFRDVPARVERDSAGVRIVENARPAWREGTGWFVDPSPSLDLSGASDDVLSRLAGPLDLGDGRLALYNGGSCEIRIYDGDGTLIVAFGSCGRGPGEFSEFGGIWPWPGDSLLVVDQLPRRLSVFGTDGILHRTMLAPRTAELPQPFVQGVLRDGTLLLSSSRNPAGRNSPGVERGDQVVALSRSDGQGHQLLGAFPGVAWVYTELGSGQLGRGRLTFSSSAQTAASATHGFVGLPDRYEITKYRRDGTIVQIVRRTVTPTEVAPGDIAWLMERRLAEVDDPDGQRLIRQAFRDLQHAEVMPSFGVPVWPDGLAEGGPALLADDAGYLWVFEHYRPGEYANRWSIFSPEGVWLGIVTLPDHLRPNQIGEDFVLGNWVDEAGYVHVRRHALERGGLTARAF